MTNGYRIAVVGAPSLAGQALLRLLAESGFPLTEIRLLDPQVFGGRKLNLAGFELEVYEVDSQSFADVDIVFFLASRETSESYVAQAIHDAKLVVDCSSAFRLDPGVPLVIPEINPQAIQRGLVASPNPAVVQLLAAIHPLHQVHPLKELTVDTLEAVSGAGASAVEELGTQTRQVLQGHAAIPHIFPHQIAFNVLPETDVFLDNGYTRDEWSLIEETRKILKEPGLPISTTAVRVPVHIGYSQIVYARFSGYFTEDDARAALARSPRVKVLDDPIVGLYPQPWTVVGESQVSVGRIRVDTAHNYSLVLWTSADNIHCGVALNAAHIATTAIANGVI